MENSNRLNHEYHLNHENHDNHPHHQHHQVIKLAVIFCLFFLLISCKNKKEATKNPVPKTTIQTAQINIGFSIDTLAIERWQRDLDVFINKAKELGANVIVQNAGNSLSEQKRQLTYLLNRNVDVIVVLPKEAAGLSEEIQKIKSKNIPVISYDRLILDTMIDLYVTINSEKTGSLMAQNLLNTTNAQNWFLMLGPKEDFNMSLITKGVNKQIKNTSVQIARTFYASGWNYDLAYNEMVSLISNNDLPDAIICGNDAIAQSVIQALDTYYTGPHIPICGQDADVAACQNIISGKQDFTIYKPITKLAEITAEIAVNLANGQKPEDMANGITINNNTADIPVVWLEPTLVTKNNIDEIIVDSGFHSRGEIYR